MAFPVTEFGTLNVNVWRAGLVFIERQTRPDISSGWDDAGIGTVPLYRGTTLIVNLGAYYPPLERVRFARASKMPVSLVRRIDGEDVVVGTLADTFGAWEEEGEFFGMAAAYAPRLLDAYYPP